MGLSERPRSKTAFRGFTISAWIFAALVFCQLGLGALVAGLRAGLIYNTWPLMGSSLVPGEAFRPAPLQAIFSDAATAQFDHRMIAYAVVAFAIVQAIVALRATPGSPLASREEILPEPAVELPMSFDGYEIHGVHEFQDEHGRFCEQAPDHQAEFWSLYGHIPGQGLDCIGDFRTREAAEEVFARITGRSYNDATPKANR